MSESMSVDARFSVKDAGLSSFVRRLKGDMTDLSQTPKKISAGFGSILKGAGVFKAVSASVDLLKSSIGGAVSRFDTLNNFPKIMKNMGVATKDSTAAVNKLSDGIDGLPTALDDMVSTTQRFFPVVKNNIAKATDSSLALNNAFLASGAAAGDASRGLTQYVQMLSSGKVDMMSWRSLQETMPYALGKVAKSFGIVSGNTQELYDKIKKGDITMAQLNDRFIQLNAGAGGFAEMAKTATGGIGTAFVNLGNRTKKGMEVIIESLNNASQELTGGSIAQHISDLGNLIANAFKAIAGYISNSVGKIRPYLDILKTAFSEMAPPVKEAIEAIKVSYNDLYATADNTAPIDNFRGAMQNVVGVVTSVSNFIRDNSDKVAYLITQLPKLLKAWLAFKTVGPVLSIVTGGLQKAGTAIELIKKANSAVAPILTSAWTKASGSIKTFGTVASQLVTKFGSIKSAASALQNAGGLHSDLMGSWRTSIMAFIPESRNAVSSLGMVQRSIGSFGAKTISAFKAIPGVLTSAVTHPIASLTGVFSSMASGVGAALGSITTLLGPVGVAIAAVVAAVVGLVVAWKKNFMNIQGFTKSVFSGIGKSLSSLKDMFKPLYGAFNDLKPAIDVVTKVLGGAFVVTLAAVAVAIGGIVDAIRYIVMGVADIIIVIKSLITLISKGGSAIGKFFSGDFKGAAKDAKAALSGVGDGISDIKENWSDFTNNSATGAVVTSFSELGKKTDEVDAKSAKLAKNWKGYSAQITSSNKSVEKSFDKVSEASLQAFAGTKMETYATAAKGIMSEYSANQVEIQKQAHAKLEAADKASGERRRQLQNQAAQLMLQDQTKGNQQMQDIMNQNTQMLTTGKTAEGEALTKEQRTALEAQNDAIRQALLKQSDMQLQAFTLEMQNKKNWTRQDTQQMVTILNQQNQIRQQAVTANNAQITQLEAQQRAAKTATEQQYYAKQIADLKAANTQQLQEIFNNNLQKLQAYQQSGQLTKQTFSQTLTQMNISTNAQLTTMLGFVNQHAGTIQNRLLVMAQYMKSAGVDGAAGLVNAISTGDYAAAGKMVNDKMIGSLGSLPNSMFKGGEKGRNQFISAMKAGKVEDAGKYIADQSTKGADTGKDKLKGSGKKGGDSFNKGLKEKKDAAHSAGSSLGESGAKGAHSQYSSFYDAGGYVGSGLAAGITSKSKVVSNAAAQVIKDAKTAANKAADSHSPSRVFKYQVGKWLPLGVAAGIDQYSVEARRSAVAMMNEVRQSVNASGAMNMFSGTASVEVGTSNSVLNVLNAMLSELKGGKQIVLDDGTLIGATTAGYDQSLGQLTGKKGRYSFGSGN